MAIPLTEFLTHVSAIVVLLAPAYFGYNVLKNIGGAVGHSFKHIIAGIVVFAFPHLVEALEYFDMHLFSLEGIYVEHAIIIISFLLIGYGFYELKNVLEAHGV